MTSLKQHIEYFNLRCKIQLDLPVHFPRNQSNLTNGVVPGQNGLDGGVEDLALPLPVLRRRLLRLHRVVRGRREAHRGRVAVQ